VIPLIVEKIKSMNVLVERELMPKIEDNLNILIKNLIESGQLSKILNGANQGMSFEGKIKEAIHKEF
jgi:hypothetical protein